MDTGTIKQANYRNGIKSICSFVLRFSPLAKRAAKSIGEKGPMCIVFSWRKA